MSKDEYYNTPEARLDTVLGDHKKFFELLRRVRVEFSESDLESAFPDWLQDRYGIKLHLTPDGKITSNFTVTDQNKYLVAMLKYGG